MEPLTFVDLAEGLAWEITRLAQALRPAGRAALLLELVTAVEEGAVRSGCPGPDDQVSARQEQVSLRLVVDAATDHAVAVGGLPSDDATAADHWRYTALTSLPEAGDATR